MKTKTITIMVLTSILLGALTTTVAIQVYAAPATITHSYNQAQFQWRASAPFGAWSYSYTTYSTSSEYRLTGKTLHTAWEYSPLVEELEGESTIYVFDKKSELWIEREGTVSYKYTPSYGDHTIVNYFRGYLDFGGETPSTVNFDHGVAYQWVYIYAPQDDASVLSILPNAQWDEVMEAWLVGFSIYLWDPTPQSYTTPFPTPFPEPVPANIYNPLSL